MEVGNAEIDSESHKRKGLYKLSVKNAQNSTSSLYTNLSLTDISWTVNDRNITTQAQTFYIVTKDHAFIMIQIGYSSLGLTSSCQVTARYYKFSSSPSYSDRASMSSSSDECDKTPKSRRTLSSSSPPSPSNHNFHNKSSSGSSFNGIFGSFLKKTHKVSLEQPTPEFHEFISQNISTSDWKIGIDGFSSEIGPLSITLIENGSEGHSSPLVHIVYKNEKLSLDVKLVPMVQPLQFGDGHVHVEKRKMSEVLSNDTDTLGNVIIRYCPKMSVTGHVILHTSKETFSCDGHASLFQITHKIKPHLLAQSWSLAVFHADEYSEMTESKKDQDCISLVLLHMNAPSSINHEVMNQGILCIGQEIHALSLNDNQVKFLESLYDHHSGRDIPTRMTYEWMGETTSGQPWKAKLHVQPKGLIDRIDLLAQVPFIIRKIIQTFVTRPFCYEWLDHEVVLELTIGENSTPRMIKGKLLHELTLL